jgi:hypothetical protein
MSQPKNWLPDDALEGSADDVRSESRNGADRPSMEVGFRTPSQLEAQLVALRQKAQRVATTPVRTWRRLLGMLALPYAFGITVLCASGAAHAEQPGPRRTASTALGACSAMAPQSSGYRDMLTRFASRQSTNGETRTLRLASSYRDFANRLQPAHSSGTRSSARAWRRYSLRAPSCG